MLYRCCGLVLSLLTYLLVSPSHAQISKGQQILINRGLQLQGLAQDDCYVHLDTYTNANYTSIHWISGVDGNGQTTHSSRPDWIGPAPGLAWARWAGDETQMPPHSTPYGGDETPFMSQLVAVQLADEWNLNDDATRTRLVNWFNAVRTNYPNTILFHNNWGSQIGDAQLADFYTRAQPDMLCFDTYPSQSVWDGNLPNHTGAPLAGPPTGWYGDLRRYREHARGANIPLAIYRQTFHSVQDYDQHVFRDPSASELRLNTFAALAFNVKFFMDFTYNTGAASLFTKTFNGSGDTLTNNNGLYHEMAEVNRRARNLGKALVRLKPISTEAIAGFTTSMMFIRGKTSGGAPTAIPVGFLADPEESNSYTDWAYQRNDPYLTNGWTITNQGTKNNGQPGDVIVSWFKPLDETFDGPNYINEVYLMVVNGLTDPTGMAADCAQEIKLNFRDGFTALDVLDANTGLLTNVPLPVVDSRRQLTLNLHGGEAALFKFSDGASFVGFPFPTNPPVILTHPQSRTNASGTSASFNVLVTGSDPLSYQWRLNDTPIADATTSSFTRNNVQSSDAGNYSVTITNFNGAAMSFNAVLTVNGPPSIVSPPQDRNVVAGNSANFTVTAVGPGTLTYQWRKNGLNLTNGVTVSGATSSALALSNVQNGDTGNYAVAVSNSFGGVISAPAALTLATQPTIQSHPQSRTNNSGTTATFTVSASGGGLVYQWRRNGTNFFDGGNVTGAASSALSLSGVAKQDATSYTVVITNAAGSVTSTPATLTVVYPLPFLEPFNYSVGANLGGQVSPSALNWDDVGTSTAGPYITNQPGSLSIAGLAPAMGNSIFFGGLGKSARLSFNSTFISGTIFYSFAFKVVNLMGTDANGGFVAGFNNSIGTQTGQPSVVGTRLYIKTASGGFNLGVAKNSSTPSDWVWDGTTYTVNQTIFVVGSYTFTTAGNATDDSSKLWLNPNPADFGAPAPPTPTLTAPTGNDLTANQIASFVFFQRGSALEPAGMVADELRIGTNWAQVTPRPVVRLDGITLLPDQRLRMQGSGDPGTVAIEASTNLLNWVDVTNFLSSGGSFEYFETTPDRSQRFYRARLAP